jgi:hypothetical protein
VTRQLGSEGLRLLNGILGGASKPPLDDRGGARASCRLPVRVPARKAPKRHDHGQAGSQAFLHAPDRGSRSDRDPVFSPCRLLVFTTLSSPFRRDQPIPAFNLILDVWTTRSSKSAFMGGTVAYIDKVSCSLFVCPWLHLNMRLVRTQAWILRVDFACFKLLTGRHDGKTLAVPVASLLERRGWDAKFAVRRFALGAPLILSYLF